MKKKYLAFLLLLAVLGSLLAGYRSFITFGAFIRKLYAVFVHLFLLYGGRLLQ